MAGKVRVPPLVRGHGRRAWHRWAGAAAAGALLYGGAAVLPGVAGGGWAVSSGGAAPAAAGGPDSSAAGTPSAAATSSGAGPNSAPAGGLVAVGAPPAVPPAAAAVGPLPASTPVSLDVALAPADPSALDRFVGDVSDPTSPDYGHYLARGQFAARFGPAASTVSALRRQLEADGLSVAGTSADGLLLHVSGTATQVAGALHVSLERYRLRGGRTGYAATSAPELPASLAAGVVGVSGLSTLAKAVPLLARSRDAGRGAAGGGEAVGPSARSRASGSSACTAAKKAATAYTLNTWTEVAKAYGFTAAYTAGDLGAGTTVGIFELEPYLTSDLTAFEDCFTLPGGEHYGRVQNVPVDGGAGAGGGFGEAILDVEDVLGLAPEANVLMYGAPNTTLGLLDQYDLMVSEDQAQVISTSWGECETVETPVEQTVENDIFEEAAAQGQTVFAAAGDTGSEDCHFYTGTVSPTTTYTPTPTRTTLLAVDDPASQPYVTGVGGTELTFTKTHPTTTDEVVWNSDTATPTKPRQIAGAGGVSDRWAKPAWQATGRTPTAVPVPASGSCTQTPISATTTTSCRQVPDVAASADPTKGGDDIYCVGAQLCSTFTTDPAITGWAPVGGTSDAAPLWAALAALTDESCGADVGFLNPRLYQLGDSSGDFRDITAGTNDATGAHPGFFTAKVGYDNASGLGSPEVAKLLAGICPDHVTGPEVHLSSAVAGAGATYTVTFPAAATLAGGDTLTLVGPAGTTFPTAAADYKVTSPAANPVVGVGSFPTGTSATANAVTVTFTDPVTASSAVTVTVDTVVNTTRAGPCTLGVQTTLDATPAQAPFTVVAGPASAADSTVVAAAPSDRANGSTTDEVTATLDDQYGNPVATVAVTLVGSAPTTSSAKVIPATPVTTSATGTASFTVTDTKSQVVTLSASLAGPVDLEQKATVDFSALSDWSATLTPDTAGATTVLRAAFATPATLTGGSTITVDAPPGATVPTASGRYAVTASTIAVTVSSVAVGDGPGSATANQATLVTATTVAADATVKVVITGATNPTAAGATFVALASSADPVPADVPVTVVAGAVDPAASSVTALAPSGPADGSSPDFVLVTLRDEWDNPIATRTVALSAPSPVVVTPPSTTTDTAGQALFELVDGTNETVTVTAEVTATSVGTASISFTGISGLAYAPLTSLTTATATTDLTTGATVDVEAFAQFPGAVDAGGSVTLTAPAGTALPDVKSDYELENGFDKVQSSFTFTLSKGTGSPTDNVVTVGIGSPSKFRHKGEFVVILITGATNPVEPGTGVATLSASGTGNGTPTYSGPLTFVVGPASKAKSTVVATPATVDVGHSSTVTVTVEDAAGNRLGGQVVRLSPSPAGAGVAGDGSTSTHGQSTTSATGVATFTVTDGSALSVNFTAEDVTEDVGLGSAAVTFSSGSPPPPPPPPAATPGYDLVGSDGGVFVFPTGQSGGFFGSLPGLGVAVHDVVGIVPTNDYTGYDLVGSDGGVFVFPVGQPSGFFGSLPGLGVSVNDVVGIVPTNHYTGYDLVGKDGGVFVFPVGQSAGFYGSLPGEGISVDNIVGIAVTGDDQGYWLAGSTGHVYNLGDAPAVASPSTSAPIVGIAAAATSKGGWLVANNGSVYPFGDAASFGTLPTSGSSVGDVVSIVPTPSGQGYWIIAADGRVFAFGDATSQGTLPSLGVTVGDVVGAVPTG